MNKKTLNMFKFLILVGLLITILLYFFSPADAILGVIFTLIVTITGLYKNNQFK